MFSRSLVDQKQYTRKYLYPQRYNFGGEQLAQINTTQSRSLLSFYVDPMLSAIKLTNLFSRIASNSLRFLTRAAFEEYNGSSAKWSKRNNYNQRKRLVFNQNYKKNSNQIGCQQAQFELKQESVFKMFLLDPTSGRTFNFSSAVCLSVCLSCL